MSVNRVLPVLAILAALGVVTMPGRAATATETTLTVVAEEGSPTPVGGTFSHLGSVAVNDLGHVVFQGGVDGGSTTEAIFLYNGVALSKVVAVGDPAPTGGTFIRIAFPDLNNHDDVVFAGETEDGIAATTAIYLASDSGVGKVVAEGDQTPVGGTFFGFFLATGIGVGDGIVEPKLNVNDSRDVGFGDKVVGGDVTGGLFVSSEGATSKIAAIGETTPIGGSYFLMAGPDLNGLGQAGVMGWTGGTGTEPAGIFLGNTTLLRNGVPSPAGSTISQLCCSAHINNLGQAASWARLADGREGFFLGDGTTVTKLMIEGEPAPELGGTFHAARPNLVDLNDEGQAVFSAGISGGSKPSAIWAFSDGVLKPVIVPGDDGTSSALGVPLLNNQGQIAFTDHVAGKIFLATVPDLCPDGLCGGEPPPPPPACGPRVVVFIRGISFTFSDDATATKPAQEWGNGFADIAEYLKSANGYSDGDFRWYNYSSSWAEGQYDPLTNGNGQYNGADTRQRLFLSAASLDRQIGHWASLCPGSRIDVIAHSLGGAVAAYWAGDAGSNHVDKVTNVLTIESPLGGAPFTACAINLFASQLLDIGGDAASDLCNGGTKDTIKLGLNTVPFLTVNNWADPVVNGCVGQGITKADGAVNGDLNGRAWDSLDFGRLPDLEGCLGNLLAEAIVGQDAHGLALRDSCKCWPHLVPKLTEATLHDDRSPAISYSGNWAQHANSARVMGTDSVSSAPEDTLTFDVPGQPSKIVWITMKGPSAGKAKVSICGGRERNLNLRKGLFDARHEYEFNIPDVCSGPELQIRVPPWRLGLGQDVNVDAFEVWE